jgi:hypothetical protein
MKIFIACSKHFYHRIPEIKEQLEEIGHKTYLPNSYYNPLKEEEMKRINKDEHIKWKSKMLKKDKKNIKPNNAIIVLNFEKKGVPNYIGGATFLEIYKAWELGKKIFIYNDLPKCSFTDELCGMRPIILNGDLALIK